MDRPHLLSAARQASRCRSTARDSVERRRSSSLASSSGSGLQRRGSPIGTQSRRRCGSGERSPGADVAAVSAISRRDRYGDVARLPTGRLRLARPALQKSGRKAGAGNCQQCLCVCASMHGMPLARVKGDDVSGDPWNIRARREPLPHVVEGDFVGAVWCAC